MHAHTYTHTHTPHIAGFHLVTGLISQLSCLCAYQRPLNMFSAVKHSSSLYSQQHTNILDTSYQPCILYINISPKVWFMITANLMKHNIIGYYVIITTYSSIVFCGCTIRSMLQTTTNITAIDRP